MEQEMEGGVLIGTKIREARLERGMKASDLAKKIGTSQSAISFIETNKRIPNRNTLRRISECLDLDYEIMEKMKCKNNNREEIESVDLIKAQEINTLVISSNLKGKCFICNNNLQLKGIKNNKYSLVCDCGMEINVPIERED